MRVLKWHRRAKGVNVWGVVASEMAAWRAIPHAAKLNPNYRFSLRKSEPYYLIPPPLCCYARSGYPYLADYRRTAVPLWYPGCLAGQPLVWTGSMSGNLVYLGDT